MVQNKSIDLEVVLVLLSGKAHLREISRKLKIPHSTLMRKINGLIDQQVIDYDFEGRNKVFSLKNNLQSKNYIFNAERYKLIKLLEKYPELGIILESVLSKIDCNLIVLFGSYASFSANRKSDIDIYIDTENKMIKNKLEEINSKINVKIGKFDKSSLLIKEIIKNHVILKGVEQFYEKISN
jgi:predicted nucleotidyltransferase